MLSLERPEVVLLDASDGGDAVHVGTRTDDLYAHLGALHDDLVFANVGWRGVARVVLHVGGNQVLRDEHAQRPHVGEKAHVVYARHNAVDNLAFERLPHDSLVLDLELGVPGVPCNDTALADVNVGAVQHTDDVSKLTCARSLHVCQELLSEVVVHLRTEVRRV